uniref:Uncharacterized protein n=1 Tax=Cucumis melo TaxID=3656 RepID=A0A9I9E9U6_CUCME
MKMLLFFIFTKSMKFVSLSNNFTPPLSILTRSLLWVLIEMNHSHGSFISTRFMLVEPLPKRERAPMDLWTGQFDQITSR